VSYVNSRVFRKRDDGDELREVATDRGKGGSDQFLIERGSMMMMRDEGSTALMKGSRRDGFRGGE
jgi:hypothetical protein